MDVYRLSDWRTESQLKAKRFNRFKCGKTERSVGDNYRPQTKFAKVMFLHLSLSHSVNRGLQVNTQGESWGVWPGGSPGPHLGAHTRGVHAQGVFRPTPRGGSPGPHLGWWTSQHALRQTPHPADGHCCGRHASYWNAFWLHKLFSLAFAA